MKAYTVLLITALWRGCFVAGANIGANNRPITGILNFVYDPNSRDERIKLCPYFKGILAIRNVVLDIDVKNALLFPPDFHEVLLVELSRDEREHVKSRTGIQDIELKMMREWMGVLNETMVFHTDPHLPPYFQTHCKGQDIYYMARTLPTGSSLPSAIG